MDSQDKKMFTEVGIQFFNIFYTALPIIVVAVYDYDLPSDVVYKYAQLYQSGIKNEKFNSQIFWLNIFNSILEAVILSVIPLFALNNMLQGGVLDTFWQSGALTYTAVVTLANIRVVFLTYRWHAFHAVFIVYSIAVWFLSATLVSISNNIYIDPGLSYLGMWHRLLGSDGFWLTFFFLIISISLKNIIHSVLVNMYAPTDTQIVLELENDCASGKNSQGRSLHSDFTSSFFRNSQRFFKGGPMQELLVTTTRESEMTAPETFLSIK